MSDFKQRVRDANRDYKSPAMYGYFTRMAQRMKLPRTPGVNVLGDISPRGGSSYFALSSNTIAITNLSGNDFETQELKDLSAVLVSLLSTDSEYQIDKAVLDVWFEGGATAVHPCALIPSIVIGENGLTIATTESDTQNLMVNIAAAVSGKFAYVPLDPVLPNWKPIVLAGDAQYYQFVERQTFDITQPMKKFVEQGGAQRIWHDDANLPKMFLLGTLRATDDGTTFHVYTMLSIAYHETEIKVPY